MPKPFDLGINSVTFELDPSSKVKSLQFGDPSVMKLGKFWFRYGAYNGYLRFVNYAQCIWFPESHGATGYGWLLDPLVSGKFHVLYNELPTLNLGTAAGDVNPTTGVIDGLRQVNTTGPTGMKPLIGKVAKNYYHPYWKGQPPGLQNPKGF